MAFNDKTSPEYLLKSETYDDKTNDTVTEVARAMEGVGKTCTHRACVLHEYVTGCFADGALYQSLGPESGKAQLIQNLANFIKRKVRMKMNMGLQNEKDFTECVNISAEWFGERTCLFLIDYIWCINGIDTAFTEVLVGLYKHKKIKVSFTTRDSQLKCIKKVNFAKRSNPDSEIFCYAVLH